MVEYKVGDKVTLIEREIENRIKEIHGVRTVTRIAGSQSIEIEATDGQKYVTGNWMWRHAGGDYDLW